MDSQYDLLEEKWSNFITRFGPSLLNAGVTPAQLHSATVHDMLVGCTFAAPYARTIYAASDNDFHALQTLITLAATVLKVDRERIENAWSALPVTHEDAGAPSKTLFWRYVKFFLYSVSNSKE